MEAYELVALHKKREFEQSIERRLDDVTEKTVGFLLDKCGDVRNDIVEHRFDETEHGHFEFEIASYDVFLKPLELVDSIDLVYPIYVERNGERTTLGRIGRKSSYSRQEEHRGWVESYLPSLYSDYDQVDEQGDPINPTDPRWEAIVEPFERAVQLCLDERSQATE